MATLSIISGASRSGTVITGSLFLGYRPEDAAKFSIYLSIPTLLGAMFFGISKNDILKEDISVLEDLICAAHNNAKETLKSKTAEEISKVTGEFGIPGFKWPL